MPQLPGPEEVAARLQSEHRRRYGAAALDVLSNIKSQSVPVSGVLTYGALRDYVENPGVDTLDILLIFPEGITDKDTVRRLSSLVSKARGKYGDVPLNVSFADLVTIADGRFGFPDSPKLSRSLLKGFLASRAGVEVRPDVLFRYAEPTNVAELALRRRLRNARKYLLNLDDLLDAGDRSEILLAQHICIESAVFAVGMLSDAAGSDQSKLLSSEPLLSYADASERLRRFYAVDGVDLGKLSDSTYKLEVLRYFEDAVTYLEAAVATYINANPRVRDELPIADSVDVGAESPVDDLFGDLG